MPGKRPRIKSEDRKAGAVKVEDKLEYKPNLASGNARVIKSTIEKIEIELWFDKHYMYRNQLGDEQGARQGISPEAVEGLVSRSLQHLLFYSARVRGFSFLNHENDPNIRVILRDSHSQTEALNVVVQAHFMNFNKYQFTVVTARCGDFRVGSGQFIIDFLGEDESSLRRVDNGAEKEVHNCQV